MTHELYSIFLKAQAKLSSDFNNEAVKTHLHTLKVRTYNNRPSSRGTDQYRAKSRVPAYYDPNCHTIYLNSLLLGELRESTVYNVCYHELVHAASYHHSYPANDGAVVYQSGIKLEIYRGSNYACRNRGLNEGTVQSIANKNTIQEVAYSQEAELVELAQDSIGTEPFYNALFEGEVFALETTFNAYFGKGTFRQFATALDKRDFETARDLVTQPVITIDIPLVPATVSV